jgi:hypothetical protein
MTRYDYDNYFKDIIDEMVDKSDYIKYPIIDRDNKLKNTPKINTTLSTENNNDDDDGYKKIPRNIVVEYECKLKQPIDNVIEL